jgi:PadR family transcriptional regulator PadR
MSTQEARERLELLQGKMDLLILGRLIFESQHGHGIARAIRQTSEEELPVGTRCAVSLAPAAGGTRLDLCQVGNLSNTRNARFYSLTTAGHKQLIKESANWKRGQQP